MAISFKEALDRHKIIERSWTFNSLVERIAEIAHRGSVRGDSVTARACARARDRIVRSIQGFAWIRSKVSRASATSGSASSGRPDMTNEEREFSVLKRKWGLIW